MGKFPSGQCELNQMLRGRIIKIILFSACTALSSQGRADSRASVAAGNVSTVNTRSDRYTEETVGVVNGWIRTLAPSCPSAVATSAARRFLDDLAVTKPDEIDKLPNRPSPSEHDSSLLRCIGAVLSDPSYTTLREDIARLRIEALWQKEFSGVVGPNSRELMEKLRAQSQVVHRRLIEGRIDDDDLVPLLKRLAPIGNATAESRVAQPKVLKVGDIASEFARRNQSGSAVQRLRAYTIEASLKTATGVVQHLILTRMRPDRFRLVVQEGDTTKLIIAYDGREYWQQVPGRKAFEVSRSAMGARIFLGEFLNPLFDQEGYTLTKLDDATFTDRKVHRISVRRTDGSEYISFIDAETFRELGRENRGSFTARYFDYREVEGVFFPFREENKDEQNRSAVLEVTRVSANAGIVQSYFERSDLGAFNVFMVEKWLAQGRGSSAHTE